MNELIEKLAEQAMAKAIAKNFTGDKLELRMPSAAWAKEFAELIVRECLQMADEFELDVNRSGLVDRMKEHFGLDK